MSLWPRALNQVGRLDPGDGTMEPGVGEQEVICLLDNLLGQGEAGGAWRVEQRQSKISWTNQRLSGNNGLNECV